MSGAITKRDLVKSVAGETRLKQGDVQIVVQKLLNAIMKNLSAGKRIELRDFGVFEPRRQGPRNARNPRTGESVQVPQRIVPRFKPGRLMKNLTSNKTRGA